MLITAEQMKNLKSIPNSGYELIKVEFLFHSNKLEGSTFTKENLEMYLNENIIEGSHKVDDVLETINSTKLFDFVIDTLGEPLSERLILEFHQMLKQKTIDQERGFVGRYKKIPNMILGLGQNLDVAQPHEVPDKMESLLKSWESETVSIDTILKFHAEFEKIHPFQDGNGRIGRFIMLKQCIENDIDLIAIDEQFSREYKQALNKAQTKNDFTDLKAVIYACQQLTDEKMKNIQHTLDYIIREEVEFEY